jgi:hypothetical protein
MEYKTIFPIGKCEWCKKKICTIRNKRLLCVFNL